VPAIAPLTIPETGASMSPMPFDAKTVCIPRSTTGSMVLMLTMTSPAWALSITPPLPTITPSACAVVSTIEITVPAWRATSAGPVAAIAPKPTT
jgi:hypothetical protein